MANNSTITVNDGTADTVLTPAGITEGRIARYQDNVEVLIAGRKTAVLSHKNGKTVREGVMTTRVPNVVSTTIDGVTSRKVVNFGSVSTKVLVPHDWSPEDTQKMLDEHADAVADAKFVAVAKNNEFVW